MKISIKLYIVVAALIAIMGIVCGVTTKSEPSKSEPQSASVAPASPPRAEVKNIPVLVYHSIAPKPDRPEGPLNRHYRITPEHFDAQMKYLQDNGYTPIRFDAYADYLLHNSEIPEKPVVLTFDDGLANQYDYAFPILEKYHFAGTFFVYPGVTGHRGFMTQEQVVALDAAGHEIGSHTVIHENLPKLTDLEKLHHEIWDSKSILESMIGHPVTTLAYPHYAENESVRVLVEQAGYIAARAGWRDVKNSADEIFHLKAQESVDTANPFSLKIK